MIENYQEKTPNQCPSLRGTFGEFSIYVNAFCAEAISLGCQKSNKHSLLLTNYIKSLQTEWSIPKPTGLLRHLEIRFTVKVLEVARNDDTLFGHHRKNQR